MKSPDIIIAEFEAGRMADRKAYRGKMLGRGFEFICAWAGCGVCFVWLAKRGESSASLFLVILAAFITDSLRKRWKLEDRVAELERRAREEPIQLPETTRGK